jgi:hypothetical protein
VIGDEADRINWLARCACRYHDFLARQRRLRFEQSSDAAHDLFRFRHSTGPASLSDCKRTFGGLQNLVPKRPRVIDVALCLRVRPHPVGHRWHQENLRLRSEEAGGEQIVREAVRGSANKIGGRWGDNDDLRFAGQPDVIERVTRTENLRMHWASRDGFERDRSNELACAASHHDIDFSPRLRKQTRQPH